MRRSAIYRSFGASMVPKRHYMRHFQNALAGESLAITLVLKQSRDNRAGHDGEPDGRGPLEYN